MITFEILAKYFPHKRNFNNCLFEYKGRQIMAYRAEDIDYGIDPRIMICEVDDNYVPSNFKHIAIPAPQPFVKYFEDPRLFEHKGRLWMAFAAAAMLNKHHFACQGVCLLTDDFVPERIFYPDMGHNHNQISKANSLFKREKNWTFFSRDNEIHFLYTINPLKVCVMDENTGAVRVISESLFQDFWEYGKIHGSTGLIDIGGRLVGMFHSFLVTRGQRAYHSGFYEIDPVRWRGTALSTEPFLSAVRDEERDLRPKTQPYRPNAIFPCGIMLDEDRVVISYGWQDCRSRVAIEDASVIIDSMRKAESYFSPQDVIKDPMACICGGFKYSEDGIDLEASHWAGLVRKGKEKGVSESRIKDKLFDSLPTKYKEKKWLPETQ